MDQKKKIFCIEVVNLAKFNEIMDWAKVKEGSHNQFTGSIALWKTEDLDDEDKTLYKITVSDVAYAIEKICIDTKISIDEEVESNVLRATKYYDPTMLEPDSINVIMQLASLGEVL
jgi:hypothetical protein